MISINRIRSPRAGSARSAGRWVGLGASALVTATGLLVDPAAAPVASADDCPDVEVIFARGTNEPPGLGQVGDAFVDSLRQQTGGLNIDTYGVNYAASKLQLHGGDGANDTINRVKQAVAKCPNTKIVLGGYSQGASVMDIVAGVPIGGISWGSSLPPEYANNIAAVATFGDVADRAGGSLPTQSAMFGSKAIDLCNPNDPICHAGPGNEWSGHTEGYVPVYTTQAAAFVASRLLAGYRPAGAGYGPPIQGLRPANARVARLRPADTRLRPPDARIRSADARARLAPTFTRPPHRPRVGHGGSLTTSVNRVQSGNRSHPVNRLFGLAAAGVARGGVGDCPGLAPFRRAATDPDGIGGVPGRRGGFRPGPRRAPRPRPGRRRVRQLAAVQGAQCRSASYGVNYPADVDPGQGRQRHERPRPVHGQTAARTPARCSAAIRWAPPRPTS